LRNEFRARPAFCAGLLMFCLLQAGPVGADPAKSVVHEPTPTRRAELLNLLRQDCGSCHGLALTGGLGLPLSPEALKDKSPEALKQTILHGRGGTPMPPWSPFMTEAEAGWIVDYLLKGLP